MSRILIWKRIVPGGDMDIFSKPVYRDMWRKVWVEGRNSGINWGNKLWFQAICSVVDTPENELSFLGDETADEINSSYDMIIYPMANFFGTEYCGNSDELVRQFENIKIPVYIIACGAQAKSCDGLESLVKKIGTPASRFIETIYKTGGEFALRGNFSKEFFVRLGYPSAVVTGCPSLFQMGRDFTVPENKCQPDKVKPVINGTLKSFEKIMHAIPESIYFSQDLYSRYLYDESFFDRMSLKKDIGFACRDGEYIAQLLGEGRIKMFADMNEWRNYIIKSGFDFSFGTKIHGSIMPILSGVPAFLLSVDTRTEEMADFFDIPNMPFDGKKKYTADDLYAAYEKTDYTLFNKNFASRFDAFERFLTEHGIVKAINSNNRFFGEYDGEGFDDYQPNKERFAKYAKRLKREAPLISIGKKLFSLRK